MVAEMKRNLKMMGRRNESQNFRNPDILLGRVSRITMLSRVK